MWFKLIVAFAILYVLIMQMAALKSSNEQLVNYYDHKVTLCEEHGGVLTSTSYHLICGDGTEIKN